MGLGVSLSEGVLIRGHARSRGRRNRGPAADVAYSFIRSFIQRSSVARSWGWRCGKLRPNWSSGSLKGGEDRNSVAKLLLWFLQIIQENLAGVLTFKFRINLPSLTHPLELGKAKRKSLDSRSFTSNSDFFGFETLLNS